MKLPAIAGVRALQGHALWSACHRVDTVLLADGSVVLASPSAPLDEGALGPARAPAGLAFDGHCRLHHVREDGGLEQVIWGRTDAMGVHEEAATRYALQPSPQVQAGGLPASLGALAGQGDFLYLADPAGQAVWVIDTWQQQIARHLPMPAPPLDLAAGDGRVVALLDDGSTWLLAPCDAPQRSPWPAVAGARRLALGPRPPQGGWPLAWVLTQPFEAGAQLHPLHGGAVLPAPGCGALLVEPTVSEDGWHVLVLSRQPGQPLLRWQVGPGETHTLPGLVAPHHDGRGLAWAPDGRVATWTARGLRHAAPARAEHLGAGWLYSIALDAGEDQARWGRVVVEACLPPGTRLRMWACTRDDLDYPDPVAPVVDDVPPTPSAATCAVLLQATPQSLFRDPSQPPLMPAPAEGFSLHDAPVIAPPGRYLWLVLQFEGTRGRSPRLRGLRVESPGHALLQQLPRTLWREPAARDFLDRYLAPIAALLDEWGGTSALRHRLLDPRITPPDALPWLARFVSLVLDPCWPEAVQRRLLLEAAPLLRTRGTLASLQRMLELLTGAQVLIVEHFRLRGGGVVGNPDSIASQAVLGAGYRVGGRIGEPGPGLIADAMPPDEDDFAHRFTVTIVAALSEAQLACARRLVEQHKPAHTAFTLCNAVGGLRAGVGAHVGLSSVLGASGGFQPAVAGQAALGSGFILGRPALQGDTP
ncbi:hypothetical protein KAK06_00850 [Ideonella sp. 4Y11]|uniref:Phage tail protein I n=1 Tax=Ideonella aquatica TaxID=2824119 RepID=A0A941BI52_9BURK|nr:phage tail protein [Ideonella aquatica]MBQ0957493.1 hypothetical protein [Ideonella aquatica]